MHVAIITNEYKPRIRGGLGTHVVNLAKHLSTHIDVSIVNWGSPRHSAQPSVSIDGRVRVVRIPCKYYLEEQTGHQAIANLYFLVGILDLQKQHPIDLLHAQDGAVGLAALEAKRLLELPLVTTVHSNMAVPRPQPGERAMAMIKDDLIAGSDQVIAVSRALRQQISRVAGSTPISIVPNGVGFDHTFTPFSAEPTKTILYTGRLAPIKGAHILLESIANLRESRIPFRVDIIGTGPEQPELQEKALEYGIEGIVQFHGHVAQNDVRTWYERAHVVVVPSLGEAFGLVALEAMAAGRPVIASNVGGLPELITRNENGLLVGPGDADDLTQALKRLLVDESLAIRLAHTGRETNLRYSWEKIAAMTIDVYGRVLRR